MRRAFSVRDTLATLATLLDHVLMAFCGWRTTRDTLLSRHTWE